MRHVCLVVLAAAALGALPVAAMAPQEDEVSVGIMQHILQKSNDLPLATGVKTGRLSTGGSYVVTVAIDPAKDYLLLGDCDDDCWDLDLDVVDARGAAIDLSAINEKEFLFQVSDEPMMIVPAGKAGRDLRVRVKMADCPEQPSCTWGLGVFERYPSDGQ